MEIRSENASTSAEALSAGGDRQGECGKAEKKPRGMRGASEEGVIDAFDSGKPPK
jgi:hypothetical protein